MNAFIRFTTLSTTRWVLALLLPLLLLGCASAGAQQPVAQQTVEDPPWRVAALTWRQGSVVFAPAGDDEWVDLPINQPLTRGDNVWTDRRALAELQLGTATLHLGGETQLALSALGDTDAQFTLLRGALNARVRDLAQGENFEIDTPNVAVRAATTGDYRIDVTPDGAVTRVIVRSGQALVYGQAGQSLPLYAGQGASFAGRDLAQVQDPFGGADAFDRFAADRNRSQDESMAARYLPIGVVGYSQLDAWGSWGYDGTYGRVWYPRVTVVDWAPYRYGRWAWVQPWGWTWVDEAPWGFAPFHYGRWAHIGHRWAWVPGQLPHRPVYSPALVAFLGGTSGGTHWGVQVGSGPGVAWYPLAPGEAWRPWYRTSPRYYGEVNRHIRDHDRGDRHEHRGRREAITAVREQDFRPGQLLRGQWQPISPAVAARAPLLTALPRPEPSRILRGERPRLQAAPPAIAPRVAPVGQARPERNRGREWNDSREPAMRPGREDAAGRGWDWRDRQDSRGQQQERPQAERVQRQQEEQLRQQQERARGEAAVRQLQNRPDPMRMQQERAQAERLQRQQEEQLRQQERARGEAAVRQFQNRPDPMRMPQDRGQVQREQQELNQRMQQQRLQAEQQRVQAEQLRIQQERARGEAAVRQLQNRPNEAVRIQQERAQAEQAQQMRQQQEQQQRWQERQHEQQQRQVQQQQEQQQRWQERQQRQQERVEGRRGEASGQPPGQQRRDDGPRGEGRGFGRGER